jgi:hypothetical protein
MSISAPIDNLDHLVADWRAEMQMVPLGSCPTLTSVFGMFTPRDRLRYVNA